MTPVLTSRSRKRRRVSRSQATANIHERRFIINNETTAGKGVGVGLSESTTIIIGRSCFSPFGASEGESLLRQGDRRGCDTSLGGYYAISVATK